MIAEYRREGEHARHRINAKLPSRTSFPTFAISLGAVLSQQAHQAKLPMRRKCYK